MKKITFKKFSKSFFRFVLGFKKIGKKSAKTFSRSFKRTRKNVLSLQKSNALLSIIVSITLVTSLVAPALTFTQEAEAVAPPPPPTKTINEILVDGATSANVAPGQSIVLSVNATGYSGNEKWDSTEYSIEGGSVMCVDDPNPKFDDGNPHSIEFIITAPSVVGSYNVNVTIYEKNGCKDKPISTILTNGVVVEMPAPVDTDGDGVPDTSDNCPAVANADQTDTDGDGLGDACDTDNDDDGVLDENDNCPLIANADQTDNDNDGIGNACDTDNDNDGVFDGADNCSLTANPDQEDADGDGVGDACDNCVAVVNADQADDDNDGTGNVCEEADTDGDGVGDSIDNCPLTGNAEQTDDDSDGFGNACDEYNCTASGAEICGDGIDQDCDGSDTACQDETPPITTASGTLAECQSEIPDFCAYESGTWASQSVNVELSCDDGEGSGCDETSYLINGQETDSELYFSEPGIYEITYWSVDEVENEENQNTFTVKITSPGPEGIGGNWEFPDGGTPDSAEWVILHEDLTITLADGSSVFLPAGTKITKSDGSGLDLSALTSEVIPDGLTGFESWQVVEGALQFGIPDVGLEFDRPITIKIFVGTDLNGQTLSVARSTSGSGGWTSDGIVPPATCVVAEGICEFTATKASYYGTTSGSAPVAASSSSSSSGSTSSGGGVASVGLTISNQSINLSNLTGTSVTISWLTSYAATGYVIYALESEPHELNLLNTAGMPPLYGYSRSTPEDMNKVTYHTVTITGLTPGATYYFRPVSHGSLAVGDEGTFTTLALGATPEVSAPSQEPAPEAQVLGVKITNPEATPEAKVLGLKVLPATGINLYELLMLIFTLTSLIALQVVIKKFALVKSNR